MRNAKSSPASSANLRKEDVLTTIGSEDEDRKDSYARSLLRPDVNSIATIDGFQPVCKTANLNEMFSELERISDKVKAGDFGRLEEMLCAQVHTLDAIFNTLAQRAASNLGKNHDAADSYLRMAFKAQSQCRSTIEAIAEVKYPKGATFIRQANIAGQQQVNNGIAAPVGFPRSEKKSVKSTNELLEESYADALDSGAPSATGSIDSRRSAVEKINRAENCPREGKGGTKCVKAWRTVD